MAEQRTRCIGHSKVVCPHPPLAGSMYCSICEEKCFEIMSAYDDMIRGKPKYAAYLDDKWGEE